MSGAYEGLTVVDFTTTIAGPHCTRLLADLGATVIKVEAPDGDMMRTRMPLQKGASRMFGQLNAGKRSVVLDLKRKDAIAAARKLALGADIVVENYRPGVIKRLGLDYETLAKDNPKLIYCSISGFGQTGPSADLAAYAPVIHATSGYDLAHLSYQPGRTRPDNCGVYVADVISGTYAFGAIGAALYHRSQTGKGQHLDVSMLEATMSITLLEIQGAQFGMPPQPKRPVFGPVATKDGYINISVASERTFHGLCATAGHPEWVNDPRFEKYLDRRANWGDLMDEFEAWSTSVSSEECLAALAKQNVPASAYRTVREAMADPQLEHRKALAEVTDAGGTFKVLNPPFRMTRSRTHASPFAAGLGEHTDAILTALGYSADEIKAMAGKA